ncbi:basic salivary proline-rich protein 1-like [Sorex araneus]|uniref:basic salivary proline-rich protein 1-like n=1 Tax=Sorex araneus TaxID=42254 RepID=UPI002433C98B|nr:basic salivary proline-rich protein 1-like [Sorex araneus]
MGRQGPNPIGHAQGELRRRGFSSKSPNRFIRPQMQQGCITNNAQGFQAPVPCAFRNKGRVETETFSRDLPGDGLQRAPGGGAAGGRGGRRGCWPLRPRRSRDPQRGPSVPAGLGTPEVRLPRTGAGLPSLSPGAPHPQSRPVLGLDPLSGDPDCRTPHGPPRPDGRILTGSRKPRPPAASAEQAQRITAAAAAPFVVVRSPGNQRNPGSAAPRPQAVCPTPPPLAPPTDRRSRPSAPSPASRPQAPPLRP